MKEQNDPGSLNFLSSMLHSPFCESTINCSKNGISLQVRTKSQMGSFS